MKDKKNEENNIEIFQLEDSPFDEINNLKTGKVNGKITKLKLIITNENESISKISKIKNFLSNTFNTNIERFFLSLNIFSFILYGISLQSGGEDATEVTLLKGMSFYVMIAVFDISSSFILSIYLSFSIFTRNHFFHLTYIFPIYSIFFLIFTGTNVDNHGFYNMITFIICLFFLHLLLLFYISYFTF